MIQKPVASATQVILNDAVANRRQTRRGHLVAKQDDEQMQGRAQLPRQHFEIGRLKKIRVLGVRAPHRLVINTHELRQVALLVVVDRYERSSCALRSSSRRSSPPPSQSVRRRDWEV